MKKIESRAASFVIVAAVYVAATVAGILCYAALPFDAWLSLLIADVVATVVTFVFSLIFKNASVYDPYWSVQPIVILVCFAIGCGVTAYGIVLLIAVGLWAVRLTANWAYTFKGLTHEDWRYVMLRERTGKLYPIVNFVGIHLVPTLVVYLCTLPAAYAIMLRLPLGFSVLFLLLCVAAVLLLFFADNQMHVFRKAKGQGKITDAFIRKGLWKHSRHPNYLGEILMWWGVGLSVAFAVSFGWYFLVGAACNTLLFLCVSIPLAEGKQSKKEGYAEYKKQTRALLPLKKFNTKIN